MNIQVAMNLVHSHDPGIKEQSSQGAGLWDLLSSPWYKDHDHDSGPLLGHKLLQGKDHELHTFTFLSLFIVHSHI